MLVFSYLLNQIMFEKSSIWTFVLHTYVSMLVIETHLKLAP
jgi:hypothetical protein